MPTRSELANALRALAIDAIEKSGSGHPGAPLGMANMAESFWMGAVEPEEIVSEGEPPPPQPASRPTLRIPANNRLTVFFISIPSSKKSL